MTIGKTGTQVYTDENSTNVIYHGTRVVGFNYKRIVLDSGGHKTTTTKKRMNETSEQFGLGFHVYQKKRNWYVVYREETVPFEDGMVLRRGRKPTKPVKPSLNFFDCVKDVK